MAPTEILAVQHYEEAKKFNKKLIEFLEKTNVTIILVESEFNSYEAEYDLIYKSNELFNSILTSKLKNLKVKLVELIVIIIILVGVKIIQEVLFHSEGYNWSRC